MKNNILVISEGPPPLGGTHVEGGGLRAWGLAKGLASHGFDVTFAYRSTFALAYDHAVTVVPKHITLVTWDGSNLSGVLQDHKIVVMRYAMGEAQAIIDLLLPEQILVSDSYIPISVEVSARRSDDSDEQLNYLRLQKSSKNATRRADYILYASDAQFYYYIGYLSGINKLNPTTYDELQERMLKVPYGVDPDEKAGRNLPKPTTPTLLWYGAFYSWFDMESLIDSLIELKKTTPSFKLIIAGAKNPYNQDAGLVAHYRKTMRSLEPIKDCIEMIPWGSFDERFDTYAKCSAIITWNHEGLENEFAWRTRLMDFVLAERPIITNGGDPLGEDLIGRGIAFRASAENLKQVFEQVITNAPTKELYDSVAHDYSWNEITHDLANQLKKATRISDTDMEIAFNMKNFLVRKAKRVATLPVRVVGSIQKNGVKETIWKIRTKLKR